MSSRLRSKRKIQNKTIRLIRTQEPISQTLHCVMMISNPCQFSRRYLLAQEYIKRITEEPHVKLYIVEIAYKNQRFHITNKNDPKHLQLRTRDPLWHKENAINIGIRRLLPANWKAVAWIDADIEFENPHWALDTLKILNVPEPKIVQLFSHALNLDRDEEPIEIKQSFGYQYLRLKKDFSKYGPGYKYWHPGYAWACNRKAYNKMNGLYEYAILGSGDSLMAFSILGLIDKVYHKDINPEFKNSLHEFQERMKGMKLGYVPGVIRHYYHGSIINRKYTDRWNILVSNDYNPYTDVGKNEDGVLVPYSEKLANDILNYFRERLEDD